MDPEKFNDNPDPRWEKVSRALFGERETADKTLFVQQVMRKVRGAAETAPDWEWPRFLRWAVPALGLAAAGFAFSLRPPESPLESLSTETLLFAQASQDDSLQALLWEEPS